MIDYSLAYLYLTRFDTCTLFTDQTTKYYHFMGVIYNSQMKKSILLVFLKSRQEKSKFTNFPKPQLNHSFFTHFQGLENGRSSPPPPHYQRPSKAIRILKCCSTEDFCFVFPLQILKSTIFSWVLTRSGVNAAMKKFDLLMQYFLGFLMLLDLLERDSEGERERERERERKDGTTTQTST